MTDKPILFSGPMVQALLDGRKTQTRRALKPQPNDIGGMQRAAGQWPLTDSLTGDPIHTRYSAGDRLWVRETWARAWETDGDGAPATEERTYYRADGEPFDQYEMQDGSVRDGIPWKPSIHMPRWASRLTLTVTNVRVQRLQDISEDDAQEEGIERLRSGRGFYDPTLSKAMVRAGAYHKKAAHAFSVLWDSINGDGSWGSNPWVAAYSFTVERQNIDAGKETAA